MASVPTVALAQWQPQFDAGLLYDDNLPRAQLSSDIVHDFAAFGRASIGRSFAAGDWADFSLTFDGKALHYDRYEGASVLSLGATAGYRRKLGLGLTAPRLGAELSIAAENSPEAVRDGYRYGAAVSLGKRFDERLDVAVGFAYDRREQRNDYPVVPGIPGDPFSVQSRTLFARGSYDLGARSALFVSAAARGGDVVSSTRRNRQIFDESAAIALDPAFGPDYIAYRLTGASTRSLGAGLAYDLSRRASLEALVSADATRARGGLDYDRRVFSLTYTYRP
jgi:hypothetical protein